MVEQYTPVTANFNPRARTASPTRGEGPLGGGYGVGVTAGVVTAGAGPIAGEVGTLMSM